MILLFENFKGGNDMGKSMQELMLFHFLMKNHSDSIVFKEYFAQENGGFTGGKIICANAAKARHYDLTMDEICGMTDFDLMTTEQAQKAQDDDFWVLRNGKAMEDQRETITHKNGEVVQVSVTKAPLLHSDGAVWGVMSITRNITVREKAKEQAKDLAQFIKRRILTPLEFIYPYIKTSNLGNIVNYIIVRTKKKLKSIEFVDQR